MNHVTEPLAPPHTCAVVPGRGMSMEPRGFFDTGNDLVGIDPRVYVSWAGAELLAQEIKWVPPEVLAEAHEELAQLRNRVRELEEENDRLDTVFDAIDTLESAGHRARRKPGRKAKKPDPVEA